MDDCTSESTQRTFFAGVAIPRESALAVPRGGRLATPTCQCPKAKFENSPGSAQSRIQTRSDRRYRMMTCIGYTTAPGTSARCTDQKVIALRDLRFGMNDIVKWGAHPSRCGVRRLAGRRISAHSIGGEMSSTGRSGSRRTTTRALPAAWQRLTINSLAHQLAFSCGNHLMSKCITSLRWSFRSIYDPRPMRYEERSKAEVEKSSISQEIDVREKRINERETTSGWS